MLLKTQCKRLLPNREPSYAQRYTSTSERGQLEVMERLPPSNAYGIFRADPKSGSENVADMPSRTEAAASRKRTRDVDVFNPTRKRVRADAVRRAGSSRKVLGSLEDTSRGVRRSARFIQQEVNGELRRSGRFRRQMLSHMLLDSETSDSDSDTASSLHDFIVPDDSEADLQEDSCISDEASPDMEPAIRDDARSKGRCSTQSAFRESSMGWQEASSLMVRLTIPFKELYSTIATLQHEVEEKDKLATKRDEMIAQLRRNATTFDTQLQTTFSKLDRLSRENASLSASVQDFSRRNEELVKERDAAAADKNGIIKRCSGLKATIENVLDDGRQLQDFSTWGVFKVLVPLEDVAKGLGAIEAMRAAPGAGNT